MYLISYFCAGALAYVPLLPLLGFFVFGYRSVVAYNSGAVNGDKRPQMSNNGNFWFAVAFLVLTVIIFFSIKTSYAGVQC